MSKGFTSSYRIVLLATGLFVCFGALGVRLVWLHVIDREALLKTITRTRQQLIVEQAKRGDIRDRNGAIFATSLSRIVLGVDPTMVRPQDLKQIPQLAAMIGVPEVDVRRLFLTKFGEAVAPAPTSPVAPAAVVFRLNPPEQKTTMAADPSTASPATAPAVAVPAGDDTDLDPTPDEKGRRVIRWARLRDDVSEELGAQVLKLGFKCVTADRVFRRAYPNNQLAAHLIGYVNRQQEPAAGVEAYADFYLRGQKGWRVGERDGRNRELAQFNTRRVPPSDGYTVFLTIDTVVQDILEQELAGLVRQYEPLKATIIVSRPQTGLILGMANYPTFDLNEYNKIPSAEMARMKNAAVADVYEPGSVFKIVAVAAAIEERLASIRSTFDCSLTKISHQGRTLSLPGEDHHFANPTAVTLAEVVSHSSNRGAAQLGIALGEERFYRYARAFGFGGKLGFPVGSEVSGILRPLKDWDPIDITRVPIGHSISATALQMHQAMSVIANDGVLLRPQVIGEVRDAAGDPVYRYDRSEMGRVVSVATARLVAQMLTGVASKNGTAPEAAIEGFDVAGKTGTTIKLMAETRSDGSTKLVYNRKHHVASFVGFFPVNRPQVAISVIIDDADHKAPGGIAYGGRVAAPAFKRIGERLIPILNIQSHARPAGSALMAANDGGSR
ncbi:MAG: penicillin-binding protein 2 [Opitutus sp.]|nr:penicillin-binding protein 2 [Opitutus sp.]